MRYKNCRDCLGYDEFIDMNLCPCDDEEAWKLHYCLDYQQGIPPEIWKGKKLCPGYIEPAETEK